MKENTASAKIIANMQVTTHEVVALPTASAPPRTFSPLLIATNAMIQAKVTDFTKACPMKFSVTASLRPEIYDAGDNLKNQNPTAPPAKMPEAADTAVSMGPVNDMAQKRGSTRKWIGLMAMACKAPTSSCTTMVEISAVTELPERPARITAVRIGTYSLT